METGKLAFFEKRTVSPYCESNEEGPIHHDFDSQRFSRIYETIKDCEALYTEQIGEIPAKKLQKKGIDIQLCSCEITSIGTCGGCCSD